MDRTLHITEAQWEPTEAPKGPMKLVELAGGHAGIDGLFQVLLGANGRLYRRWLRSGKWERFEA